MKSHASTPVPCPLCFGGTAPAGIVGHDFLFRTTDKAFHLNSCAACACLFIAPMPSEAEIRSFYPSRYWWNGESRGWIKAAEGRYRRAALAGHVRFMEQCAGSFGRPARDVRILDVGCGSATLLGLLRAKGYQVQGLDTSEEASRIAWAESGVSVRVGALPEPELPSGAFDVISLFHVMEHVPNPRSVLAEVHRLLAPSGRLVIQVPNIDSLQFRLFGARWYGLDIPRHLIDYSYRSLQSLLETAGFRILRTRHFNLRDNAPALASSLLPSLDPISRVIRKQKAGVPESPAGAALRHAVYFLVVLSCYPAALFEAAIARGATVMVEAARQ